MIERLAGGLVVTPEGSREADVVVEDGRIVAVVGPGRPGPGALDARGAVVLPGGVDPHTHLLADLAAGTRAAVAGGTTTAISFTLPAPGQGVAEALVDARDEIAASATCDVALHAYVREPDALTTEDVEAAAALGATGIKLFTAYRELGLHASDRTVYETLRVAAALALPVLVHCENGDVIDALVAELVRDAPRDVRSFARSRPPAVEAEAVARVLALAEMARAPVYLVHVSTARSMAHVREARRRGVDALAEVCAHHLAFDASSHEGPGAERFLTVPPLRPRSDVDSLWEAIIDGSVDTVGSDHAQARYQPPATSDFTGLPYGLSGVELRLPVTLALGRARGVSWERLADLLAGAPARAFGLAPRKGAIEPGADADLVVWDQDAETVVDAARLHDGLGASAYDRMRLRGRVRAVVVRGELAVADGEPRGAPAGRYLAASRPATNAPPPLSGPT